MTSGDSDDENSVDRFKGIDVLRRRQRFQESREAIARRDDVPDSSVAALNDEQIPDDRLRLIFACCHPALATEIQVAMTLREVCGLTTEAIASAFFVEAPTMAQRIVRGKAKIRNAGIPFQMPSVADIPERIEAVLAVCYLVFTEGYSASSGESLMRPDLSGEAIRLARLIYELLPDAEVSGLLALMLLHDSRNTTRCDTNGDLVLPEDQDRTLWNRELIEEASRLIERALSTGEVGPYTIQAAISRVHAAAGTAAETDWQQIVEWFDLLAEDHPSPIIELNRAVAVAMRDCPSAGLERIDSLLARGELTEYHLTHAARADLCRRAGRIEEAVHAYGRALSLTRQLPERRFLQKRLNELG
jgi:RNA polymerase sigma-70 factor, ECF subfamily